MIRTDGTLAPCFPLYPATFDWGNIESFRFDYAQLKRMKKTCQSTASRLSTTTWPTATTMRG